MGATPTKEGTTAVAANTTTTTTIASCVSRKHSNNSRSCWPRALEDVEAKPGKKGRAVPDPFILALKMHECRYPATPKSRFYATVREDHLNRRYLPRRQLQLLGVVKHLQQVVRRVKHLKAVRIHLSLKDTMGWGQDKQRL